MTDAPITARRAQTRARLLEAAHSVFAERGVQAASVEEICEAADFTRGAFYSNFADKDELCVAMLENYRDAAYAAAGKALERIQAQMATMSIEQLINSAIEAFLAYQRTDSEWLLVNADLRLVAVREPSIREAYTRVYDEGNRLFGELMEPALAGVGYRLRIDTPRALLMMQAAYEQTGLGALVRGHAVPVREARQTLAELLRALLVPLEGEPTG